MKKPHLHGPFTANKTLNAQQVHWERTFLERGDVFGLEPSYAARRASEAFKGRSGIKILELGGGQGRDTLFFAGEGFQVNVLDYSNEGLKAIREKAQKLGVSQSIVTLKHDIRQNLPFEDASFDGCFSHMLYCMALTTVELEFISQEIRRVLKPEGLNIYTVRNTNDVHYQTGIHRGEDMREVGGFIVHFFNMEKVERLAEGYTVTGIEEFEEGNLPRRLFLVILKKTETFPKKVPGARIPEERLNHETFGCGRRRQDCFPDR